MRTAAQANGETCDCAFHQFLPRRSSADLISRKFAECLALVNAGSMPHRVRLGRHSAQARRCLMKTVAFTAGGYRYIPAVFQYSGGVAAEPGFAIQRTRFQNPVPLRAGFSEIARRIRDSRRPLTAFCACELRSPAPFTEASFRAFNEIYVETLREWGLF